MNSLEANYEEVKAQRSDPACCEICGGWLGNEKRALRRRAHEACYQELMAEWEPEVVEAEP